MGTCSPRSVGWRTTSPEEEGRGLYLERSCRSCSSFHPYRFYNPAITADQAVPSASTRLPPAVWTGTPARVRKEGSCIFSGQDRLALLGIMQVSSACARLGAASASAPDKRSGSGCDRELPLGRPFVVPPSSRKTTPCFHSHLHLHSHSRFHNPLNGASVRRHADSLRRQHPEPLALVRYRRYHTEPV